MPTEHPDDGQLRSVVFANRHGAVCHVRFWGVERRKTATSGFDLKLTLQADCEPMIAGLACSSDNIR
jgi:hypothetical protein